MAPVIIAALIAGGATTGASYISSRESDADKRIKANVSRQSDAETKSLEQRTGLISNLISTISDSSGERPPTFQFGPAAGGPANDPGFYDQLRPMAGLNMLMSLAGMAPSNFGATSSASLRSSLEGSQAAGGLRDLGSNLSFIIAELMRGRGQGGVEDLGIDPGRVIDPNAPQVV